MYTICLQKNQGPVIGSISKVIPTFACYQCSARLLLWPTALPRDELNRLVCPRLYLHPLGFSSWVHVQGIPDLEPMFLMVRCGPHGMFWL